MSACDNCPCNTCDDYGDEWCGLDLDIFDAWNKPDVCLDGEALKARRENPELVLMPVPKDAQHTIIPFEKGKGPYRFGCKADAHILEWSRRHR